MEQTTIVSYGELLYKSAKRSSHGTTYAVSCERLGIGWAGRHGWRRIRDELRGAWSVKHYACGEP